MKSWGGAPPFREVVHHLVYMPETAPPKYISTTVEVSWKIIWNGINANGAIREMGKISNGAIKILDRDVK